LVTPANVTLIQYVQVKHEGKTYLPLMLNAYHTAIRSSTGYSPFELIYESNPKPIIYEQLNTFDSTSYPSHLQAKLAEICDFVEVNLVESANRQIINYNKLLST